MRAAALVAVALALAAPAAAQTPIIDRAASAARGRRIYIHSGTHLLTAAEARRLEPRIAERSRGPLYVAILPPAARREVDGTTLGVALELNRRIVTTNPPAVHAVVIGDEFRAVNRDIDAGRLALESLRANRNSGLAAVLLDFARRVGEARKLSGPREFAPLERNTDDAGEDLWILALVVVAVAGGAAVLAHRRHAG
ncbi:MAG TPA: hypothetical protein VFG93_04185 [Gaiellaceae bacterium]|nr:hypothetical protein [Gaiellaceae bacterium]